MAKRLTDVLMFPVPPINRTLHGTLLVTCVQPGCHRLTSSTGKLRSRTFFPNAVSSLVTPTFPRASPEYDARWTGRAVALSTDIAQALEEREKLANLRRGQPEPLS